MIKDIIKIIKDYFKLVHGSKKWIFFLFLSSILGHLVSLLIPVFASNIVYYVTSLDPNAAYLNIALLAITYTAYNLLWYLNYVSYTRNFQYSYKSLRKRIVDKVFTYDNDFTDKISKANILNTVNSDTGSLSEMVDKICEIMVVSVKVIVMVIIFLKTNFAVGILVILVVYLYSQAYDYCNICTTKYLMGQQRYRDKLTDSLSQILNGLSEIKLFNIYDKIKHNFNIITDKWADYYGKRRHYANIRGTLIDLIIHYGKIGLYLVLTYLVLKGKFEINVLVLLVSYFESIVSNTDDLMDYSRQLREWSVSISRIKKVLNYTSDQQIEFGENENDSVSGVIEFKNVNFSYKAKNRGAIHNISFTAEPNKITALVGHSGSGKTSIINLLLRKYKVASGKITLDGIDIYDYTKGIYSSNVVGVNQAPFIFTMSIRKNLSLIDSNHKRQIEACKRVGIHDYIMSLPKGYDTILTENATNFSGGQRQLLSIARTLLSRAEVLIFDEVTSSLDTILVEKIKAIFEDLKQDHTVILITHKKDVMSLADKIVVLNQGKVVGIGSHDELMEDNPYYIDIQTNNYSSSHKKPDPTVIVVEDDDEEGAKE